MGSDASWVAAGSSGCEIGGKTAQIWVVLGGGWGFFCSGTGFTLKKGRVRHRVGKIHGHFFEGVDWNFPIFFEKREKRG